MTLSQTRALLDQIKHRPQKKRGQNFAIDNNIIRKSLDWAEIKANDVVVEIGPGLGALTNGLLERGATVFAVEKDVRLKKYLESRFEKHLRELQLNLIEGDCLDFPLGAFVSVSESDALKERCHFKIVANLPYAISTPWLERVLSSQLPTTMVLMLQREAAIRYLAEPGTKSYSPISIFLQSAYMKKNSHTVSANCFYPQPEVDSVLLQLDRKSTPFTFHQETRVLIREIFQQRRKQINTFQRKHICLRQWIEFLQKSGIPADIRAESISIEQWQYLDKLCMG